MGLKSVKKLLHSIICLGILLDCEVLAKKPESKSSTDDLDWWEKTIIYQIYPRSFMDSNGDGIGDLNGITSKLDYLKEIGVDATWISPIFKSPMYDGGYDVTDFYTIHDEYGTMEDFENLLAKAKELEMKLILDFVPNHTSNESEWFQKSKAGDEKYRDWFIWEDPVYDDEGNRKSPNNWLSVFGNSAWEYVPERDQYYLHQFTVGQPDLNLRNLEVVEETKNIIRFWLEKGVDGLRIDAPHFLFEVDKENYGGRYPDEPRSSDMEAGPNDYDYLDHIYTLHQEEDHYMAYEWREVFEEFKKGDGITRLMLTEVYGDIKKIIQYFGNDDQEGSHIPFNFQLIDVNLEPDARDFKISIDKWLTYKPLKKTSNWVLGNHDQSRVASRYRPELVDALNIMIMLSPGVAITYYGEEIGMIDGYVSWEDTVDPWGCNTGDPINYLKVSRDPARTPMQWNAEKNAGFSAANKTWLPVAAGYEQLNVEVQKETPKSHLNVYKAVAALRREPVFRVGRYESIALNEDVFAYVRSDDKDVYVVVSNLGSRNHLVDMTYFEKVNKYLEVVVTNIASNKTVGSFLSPNSVIMAANEALVLKQNHDEWKQNNTRI